INGLFTAETPLFLIMAFLLIGGLFLSMAFSGVNAMAFGDVDDADSSQATAINAVVKAARNFEDAAGDRHTHRHGDTLGNGIDRGCLAAVGVVDIAEGHGV
ncbi:hypothetical protein ACCT04_34485, partial [Rhizobium ruizarguesonis]